MKKRWKKENQRKMKEEHYKTRQRIHKVKEKQN